MACRSFPAVMEIYNLEDVVTVYRRLRRNPQERPHRQPKVWGRLGDYHVYMYFQVIDLLLFKGTEELSNIVTHSKQRHHLIGQYVVGRGGLVQDMGTKEQGISELIVQAFLQPLLIFELVKRVSPGNNDADDDSINCERDVEDNGLCSSILETRIAFSTSPASTYSFTSASQVRGPILQPLLDIRFTNSFPLTWVSFTNLPNSSYIIYFAKSSIKGKKNPANVAILLDITTFHLLQCCLSFLIKTSENVIPYNHSLGQEIRIPPIIKASNFK
ncbi:hypothetical protein C4D60_Mb08t22030 [Musa balbisiana]|uniref:Uncharacterized protein n=1 Tax=Musa balbisiana TaxID=52838 RepID=A0A4S8K5M3_MUSBA|nr:hypothetical protein C4D60_Mb08t22030 [Musa balbisiana]